MYTRGCRIHCVIVGVSLNRSAVSQSPYTADRDSRATIMSTPKKRIVLSIGEKIKILDRLKNGETRQSIVTEICIGMRTLERIVSSEAEIRKKSETAASLSRKRKREGKNGDVEEAIGTWFTIVLNKKQVISGR